MGIISPTLPNPGDPRGGEEVDARNVLAAILTLVNGQLDESNLANSLLSLLGVSSGGVVRRGKSIIAAEETRANAAYGTMPTPDRVSGLVLPTDGLIVVLYDALTKTTGATSPRAALFIGANQLHVPCGTNLETGGVQGAPSPQTTALGPSGSTDYRKLVSFPGGLTSASLVLSDPAVGNQTNVATGQVVSFSSPTLGGFGGVCCIWAAAGTYDISVQFKSATGSITAKERKLWVEAVGF